MPEFLFIFYHFLQDIKKLFILSIEAVLEVFFQFLFLILVSNLLKNMDYAITQTSGKQFVLKQNQWFDMDLVGKAGIGDFLCLNKVLFFRKDNKVQLGKPFLTESLIPVKVIQQVLGEKITVLKTKPKKKYTRTRGHRQKYTRVLTDS
jgi:large subunit ribosomal protein L21